MTVRSQFAFLKNRNNHVERNVLENLLDTFENRMKAQIGC